MVCHRFFIDLASRANVGKTLQRLVVKQQLSRIDRDLYYKPQKNELTGKLTVPDYWKVIDAVARRDQVRVLPDGMTCANELGLTNTVPGKVVVHIDGRLRPIKLGNLTIKFKLTAPSKLYWAGHPAIRIVQSLYWLHDELDRSSTIGHNEIKNKIIRYLQDSKDGVKIKNDLSEGFHTLPAWMQDWLNVSAQ